MGDIDLEVCNLQPLPFHFNSPSQAIAVLQVEQISFANFPPLVLAHGPLPAAIYGAVQTGNGLAISLAPPKQKTNNNNT